MTSYCSYTPTGKEQSTQNKTKMCAIIVFYVYFVLYIELLFGDVGLNGSLNDKFSQQSLVSSLSDIKDIGIYYIHNSSEMPSAAGWYVILSFARQDGSTIPMIAMDQYTDSIYYGRLYNGNNGYQLTSWNKL